MDPVVSSRFDEVIRTHSDLRGEFESSSSWLEQRVSIAEAEAQQIGPVAARVAVLENFATAQYNATVVADNWGGHFDERVSDLERRVLNIELTRYAEIQNARDERVDGLEYAVREAEDWRPPVESSLFHLRSDLDTLVREHRTGVPLQAAGSPELVAGQVFAGAPTD